MTSLGSMSGASCRTTGPLFFQLLDDAHDHDDDDGDDDDDDESEMMLLKLKLVRNLDIC